jgi:hypothetical protein
MLAGYANELPTVNDENYLEGTNRRSSSEFATVQINQTSEKSGDIMIIKGNNGKAPARKRQSVAASSSTKSKRSTVISKTGNSESAGDRVLERD